MYKTCSEINRIQNRYQNRYADNAYRSRGFSSPICRTFLRSSGLGSNPERSAIPKAGRLDCTEIIGVSRKRHDYRARSEFQKRSRMYPGAATKRAPLIAVRSVHTPREVDGRTIRSCESGVWVRIPSSA